MRLANKTAIVTGVGQGIGLAVLCRFVQEGARVVALEWDASLAEQALAGLPTDQVAMVVGDASAQAVIDQALQQALDRFGGLQVLVNCALLH